MKASSMAASEGSGSEGGRRRALHDPISLLIVLGRKRYLVIVGFSPESSDFFCNNMAVPLTTHMSHSTL